MPLFLAIGECMVELSSLGGDTMRKAFAGDTFNTAFYARAFLPADWSVEYLTGLGDDRASAEMAAFMAGQRIGTRFSRRIPGRSPGLYMIHLEGGERSFSYWRSASAARELAADPAILAEAMAAADLVYLSGITLAILPPAGRDSLFAALAEAKARGKTIAFDPNIRPRLWEDHATMLSTIERAASLSSIVLPSFDDEAAFFGDASRQATIARYLGLGARQVVLKDGARGAILSDGQTETEIAAVQPRQVLDTTAAGDSFNGAYLARLAAGVPAVKAARFAAGVAAAVIGHPGALIDRQDLGIDPS